MNYHNSSVAKPKGPWNVNSAALQNLTPEFYSVLERLKLNLLAIEFEASLNSRIHENNNISATLDRLLRMTQCGQFDSVWYGEAVQLHFFHVPARHLAKALTAIKAHLTARGLLSIASIYCAESECALRVYWPPTAELIVLKE